MKSTVPEISIIIRTKNEERWISHCLRMVFDQDYDSFEVILVDNDSSDHTVEVAKRFPLTAIIQIAKFKPGKALNDGIRASNGRYIVCLSSHCIPKNRQWLNNLVSNFDNNDKLAGVYGRQLPVSFTEAVDKRDLLIVFGQDLRVQKKDYFFHNANSMLPRKVWERFPFDENVTNIEDRVWGKAVIEAGFHIIYDPKPAVYHHHGIHQGNTSERAKGVVSIIEQVDTDVINELPESLKPESVNISAVLLVQGNLNKKSFEFELLSKVIKSLKSAKFVNNIFIVSIKEDIAISVGGEWLDRSLLVENEKDINVEILLSRALKAIENKEIYSEAILYVNHHYPFRPARLFDDLILNAQYNGYDTVFTGFVDYAHYWHDFSEKGFIQIDSSMDSRPERKPIMRALYGLGCVTSSSIIRTGKIVGGKIGIQPIDDFRFTLNSREIGAEIVIKSMIAQEVKN